jgi:DNA-binding MarR family transcriptional regulator
MPAPRRSQTPAPRRLQTAEAADALAAVAPLASRWIERLLSGHQPPLTVAQYLALRAIAAEQVSGSELAQRAGVSGPAVSQLLASLSDAGLLERRELAEDRRRFAISLTARGRRTLDSAQQLLRERLAALLVDLPRPEADALARALPAVEAALSGAPPPRRPHPARPRRGPARPASSSN